MKRAFVLMTFGLMALSASYRYVVAAESASAVTALKAALGKRAEHAARWLDEKDFKSLVQSTGGIVLLVEVLKAKGDEPTWQSSLDEVLAKTRDLQSAARDEDQDKCRSTLAAVEQSINRLQNVEPTGKPQEFPKVAIRPLMLTLDSVQADAKVALLTGNAAAAKNQAAVLAELARLVSNSRTGETWSALASDFQRACEAAANTSVTDSKAVRQLFRGIAERCESCHENSRQR
jgi:hypothetical protein